MWDKEGALKRVRGKQERLLTLIDMFLKAMPDQLSQLDELINADDNESLRKLCHSAKSSAANVGANTLKECFAEMEYSEDDSAEHLSSLLSKANAEYQTVETLLSEYRDSLN